MDVCCVCERNDDDDDEDTAAENGDGDGRDRKSTRLNSSHGYIAYAVFCLKKKKKSIKNSNQRSLNLAFSETLQGFARRKFHKKN